MVIAQDTNQFHSVYPAVSNVLGNLNFGLENSGDSIYLFNAHQDTIIALNFSNSSPFPRCANGFGRTLENKYMNATQVDSMSWFCGCVGGSPGEAYFPCIEPIIFSEFNLGKLNLLHNAEDWVELKNNSSKHKKLKKKKSI